MGIDVYGRNPTGERGEYFRSNWHWWHPLADYCIMIAPDICGRCTYWHSNDGDGLDAAGAVTLAEALQKEVDSGRMETYAQQYAAEQELMPDELCACCLGGMILAVLHRGTGDLKDGGIKCNKCQGTGYRRPVPPFSTENVSAFIAFLRESGGFAIW